MIRLFFFFLFAAFVSDVKGLSIAITGIPGLSVEPEVNDIPFDTHEIAIDYFFDKAMLGVELRPDTDVNDIPFNTALIMQLNLGNYMRSFLTVPAEAEVDDIPFDTHEIVQQYRMARLGNALKLKPELTVNDITFEASAVLASLSLQKRATVEPKYSGSLSGFLMNRLVTLVKAGLIAVIILLSAGILGFLFFSYVY